MISVDIIPPLSSSQWLVAIIMTLVTGWLPQNSESQVVTCQHLLLLLREDDLTTWSDYWGAGDGRCWACFSPGWWWDCWWPASPSLARRRGRGQDTGWDSPVARLAWLGEWGRARTGYSGSRYSSPTPSTSCTRYDTDWWMERSQDWSLQGYLKSLVGQCSLLHFQNSTLK